MASVTQAPVRDKRSRSLSAAAPLAASILASLILTGCGMGSMSTTDAAVDHTTITANIPAAAQSADPERSSDETTIRNAVSSADISTGTSALAWANADTGSRGAISSVVETQESGTVCRKFRTTRESFDGIAIFDGKTCMVNPGSWQLTAFQPL